MLVAQAIRVFTLERDAITVSWEIKDTVEDMNTYTVSVWRSESAGGPYQRVSQEMNAGDVFLFEDRSVNIFSKWREFFYRIRFSKDDASQEYGSTDPGQVLNGKDPGGVVMEAPPDIEALETMRRFELVLREYAGRQVITLTERTWGQTCGQCWDALKRRRTMSSCQTCFDTGYAGGFFSPVLTRCMKPPSQIMTSINPMFEIQPNDLVMWFGPRPRLKPRDVVIGIDGRRWRVINLAPSEKGWARTRQTIQMRELSKDQIEYKIPIKQSDWGVDNMTAGALRQHIRATNMESYNKALQDLGLAGVEVFPAKSEIATNLEDSDAGS